VGKGRKIAVETPSLVLSRLARYTNARMAETRKLAALPRTEEVLSRLEKGPLAPLYLFYGEEPYLVQQALTLVCQRMGKGTEVRTFYAGEDSLDALLEAWGVPSLFAVKNLIVLKSAERLKAADRERLANEAERRDATQPLVVCGNGRLDLAQKFFERCAKVGIVGEFRPPFANQLPGWVQRFAQERNVQVTDEAASLLADLVGPDLFALAAELDKLVAFVSPQTLVGEGAVTACVGDLNTASVFDLADALGQRNLQKALGLFREVLTDDREALPVLQALVRHFRQLWQVKELLASGMPETQIERTVNVRGLRLRALVSQSRFFSATDLQALFRRMAELDVVFKSTRTSPAALFDELVFAACRRSG
jgi:DNA polymerase-3 subunit delta